MATDSLSNSISKVKSQLDQQKAYLDSSQTASSNSMAPTTSDLRAQVKSDSLNDELRKLQKTQLTERWYGKEEDVATDDSGNSGFIGATLDTLSKPLHGIVSGIRSLSGQPSNGKEDFSDLLKSYNVPYPIAAPLGFALDVTLDPVNWLTAGTGALVPRTALGLARAGAGGAKLGLESSLLQKASGAARFIPGVKRSSFAERLSAKANASWENYKGLTGLDPLKNIDQAGITLPGMAGRTSLNDVARGIFSYIPKGDQIYNSLYYSSRDWLDNRRLMDAVERSAARTREEMTLGTGAADEIAENLPTSPNALSHPTVKPNFEFLKNIPPGRERDAFIDEFNKVADDVEFISANPKSMAGGTAEQNTWRLLQEADNTDELRGALSQLKTNYDKVEGATGIGWYDKSMDWAKNVKMKIGEKEVAPIKEFLDVYQSVIQGVFKPAHTVLSPVTWVMNVMSAPVMYMMMGGENVSTMMKYYKQAYSTLNGKDSRQFLLDLTENPEIIESVVKNPGVYKDTFGVGQSFFLGKPVVDKMMRQGKEAGLWSATNEDEAMVKIKEFVEEMRNEIRAGKLSEEKGGNFFSSLLSKTKGKTQTTSTDLLEEMRKTTGKAPMASDLPAGFMVKDPDVSTETLDKLTAFIAKKAEEGSMPATLFQNFMQSARAGYEHLDQSMRMAIFMSLTKDGLSEKGIRIMSRFSPFTPETDLASKYVKNGQTMWRLSPMKAVDIANDAAINYGAMPAAIRMLRSMPIVGAPFAAFSYGMGLRTAQTLAYNPALFNKATFAMQSFAGEKTPLEKKAIAEKPYYKWYDEPTMFRMPVNFFENYPLYTNLTSVLPYYTLNMFQPANRSYEDVLPNTVVQLIDKSPILKDPIGQTLFDFFVLPSMLAGADRPTSALGSPVYPTDATAGEKAFYAGRQIADALVPAVSAPAGLVLPPEYADLYPGYRTRQMSFGRDQRNQLGIPGSEPASSRTIRSVLGYLGLPVHPLNTEYVSSEVKNQLGE